MKDITRRDCLKGLAASVGLGVVPSITKATKKQEINYAWGEAIKENNLRNEVSGLMKKNNLRIEYHKGSKFLSAVRSINYRKIKGFDMPIEKLYETKDRLKKWENFGGGFKTSYGFLCLYEYS